jgi:hypothetical protein
MFPVIISCVVFLIGAYCLRMGAGVMNRVRLVTVMILLPGSCGKEKEKQQCSKDV